ncbi:hypothetical protein AYO44_18160 [Planctomycetaceae bacterium SCGC AG-212-F19]|nr:hypothetical protein AYO44_18160 [Planctomycetaceae bacterium SCGC AG-212-F19]
MRSLIWLLALGLTVTPASLVAAAEPVLAKDLTDNVRVRVVAARIGETRGQNLMVRLVRVDDPQNEAVVTFPSHSHTPHELTLMNFVRFATAWDRDKDAHEWQPMTADVVLSVPKDATGRVTDYSRWFLVSIKARGQ